MIAISLRLPIAPHRYLTRSNSLLLKSLNRANSGKSRKHQQKANPLSLDSLLDDSWSNDLVKTVYDSPQKRVSMLARSNAGGIMPHCALSVDGLTLMLPYLHQTIVSGNGSFTRLSRMIRYLLGRPTLTEDPL